jgi:hypothetical protein
MNNNLNRVISHALEDINRTLRLHQERLLLQKRFGLDAVLKPEFYAAGDHEKAKAIWNNLEEEYKDLLAFAKQLQKLKDESDAKDWENALTAFMNSKL